MFEKTRSWIWAASAAGSVLLATAGTQAATLVAYWNFDNTANSSVGSYNLTANGTVGYGAGKFGGANGAVSLVNNGTSTTNNLSVATDAALRLSGASGFTVSFWVNTNSTSGMPLACFSNPGGYGLYAGDTWYSGSTSGGWANFSAGAYGTSTWNNLVLSWNGSNLIGYLNGSQVNSVAMTAYDNTTPTFMIGNDNRAGGAAPSKAYNGLLDDAAIFNGALTVAQTQSIYNVGNSTLDYSMADMNNLFTLYANAGGTTTTSDGKTWQYNASGLSGTPGTLVGSGPAYSVIFSDGGGTAGVSTVIPEPASLGMGLLGMSLLLVSGGRWKR